MFRTARPIRLVVLPLLAVLVSACETTENPYKTVVGPSLADGYVAVTETFAGTLASGGTNFHTFHTMPGLVKVTLVSVDPADAPQIGMAIGMWDGLSCVSVLDSTQVTAATTLTGTASMDSKVCIKVWDPSTLASDAVVKYQLSAVHNENPPS
jgi:hypothetical protein